MQGLRVGFCLTLGNELFQKTHMLTREEAFFGKGLQGGEQQGKGNQENCFATWLSPRFYGDGISFPVVFGQLF